MWEAEGLERGDLRQLASRRLTGKFTLVTVTTVAWAWHKDRHTGQRSRAEPRNDLLASNKKT
jgi:hypothetical protein